jgi:uridine phosphorylase
MIPRCTDKYDSESVFGPADALGAQSDGVPEVPPVVLLGYQDSLTTAVRDRATETVHLVRSQSLYRLSETVGFVPVGEFGVGAPVSGIVAENVIAAGAEAVVLVTGSGTLQPSLDRDTAILPTRAIRDEGVSHHYLPSTESVAPTVSLVDSLDDALGAADFETTRGPTWTTSALYRETVAEIERYAAEGVVTVGMETAAVWAVCAYRGVETATVQLANDCLTDEEWDPESDGKRSVPDLLDPVIEGATSSRT